MIRDFKYIIKRILIGVGVALCLGFLNNYFLLQEMILLKKFILFSFFIISIFLFNPLDSHALNIYFYGNNYSNLGRCTDLNWCVPNDTNTANIIAVRVEDTQYQIIADSKYQSNQTFKVWNKANNFSIRDDVIFYAGAIRPNTITYNAKNSATYDEFGQTYIVNYGVANEFTSLAGSTGYFYEYYFPTPMQISRFEISQWDIINTGSTTGDIINNSTNTIINNNNQNTQNIIDSQNQINNTLNDDNVDESTDKALDFFNNFDSGNTGTLTDIISLPLDFLDKLNDTCSPIVLPVPYMGNITLPCIQSYLSTFLPDSFLNLIRLVVNGFLMYKIIISLIDFINTLKDPNNDDLEVMDL